MHSQMPEMIGGIYGRDPIDQRLWLRVLLRAPESLGTHQKRALIDQVQQTSRQHFPEAVVTGYYVLLAKLIENLLADQWRTFAISVGAIVAMLALALQSMRLAAVAILPNVLPIVLLFGGLGWLELRINMGAAMIAAVSVGLSVDGSIHYLVDYQRRRRLGTERDQALEQVQRAVGQATVLATLALVVGFGTLASSEFVPTIYFGTLVGLSMLGGLVGNLVLLPLLIRAIEPQKVAAAGNIPAR